MATFSDLLTGVEVTPGEGSQILYSWANNFHDSAPELANKLRAAADKQAYPEEPAHGPKSDTDDTHVTRKRVAE